MDNTTNRGTRTIVAVEEKREDVVVEHNMRQGGKITWTDDVVDNEGTGKRKSNKC